MPLKVPAGIEDSWTDDLPHCGLSGEGHGVNQVYRKTGHPTREHCDEDSYFRLRSESGIALYGICDGHDGKEVADYAAQKLPAELLLGQITYQSSSEDIKDAIKQAFQAVENGFLSTLDPIIATRDDLVHQFTNSISHRNDASANLRQQPDYQRQISALNRQITAGSTAAIALLIDNKLYVANIGDVRVLVCKTDSAGNHRVFQLSTDHHVQNEDEAFRLGQLGLHANVLEHFNHVTRCLGCHSRKGGYKDFELISNAVAEPVIAEPDIVGPIPIDASWMFLFICSAGLYNCYLEAIQCSDEKVNSDIAGLIGTAFSKEPSLSAVAQSVVDQIARLHYQVFMNSSMTEQSMQQQQLQFSSSVSVPNLTKGDEEHSIGAQKLSINKDQINNAIVARPDDWNISFCHRRDDMTLIVRNFNFPLSDGGRGQGVLSPPSLSAIYTNPSAYGYDNDSNQEPNDTDTSLWQQQGNDSRFSTLVEPHPPRLPLDANGRIPPYVDFTQFFEAQARYQLEMENENNDELHVEKINENL